MAIFDLTTPSCAGKVRYLSYTVPARQEGTEAGVILRRTLEVSSTWLKTAKRLPDGITADGKRITTRTALGAGQVLRIRLSDTCCRSGIVPCPGPLDIVYEDEDLVVLNKTAGIPVHPSPQENSNTIGNFLLYYYEKEGISADFHPVHRLDRGTSGLILVAKHAYAQDLLRRCLHTDSFQRAYLAVCDGHPVPSQGTIDLPIRRSEGSVIRREVCREDGCPARTDYKVLRTTAGRSLVHLALHTGRTHQIRVHMAAIGCPLTGDFLYGRENHSVIDRPALHAAFLSFVHPLTRKTLEFTCGLPKDMKRLIE